MEDISFYDEVRDQIDYVLLEYKKSIKDNRLTFDEATKIGYRAVATFVKLSETFTNGTPEEKKQIVVMAVTRLYEEVIEPIDIVAIPNFAEQFVDMTIKSIILAFVEASIDATITVFRKMGWAAPAVETEGPQKLTEIMVF